MNKILLIAACVCFGLAAFGVVVPVVALVPLGLCLWVLASIL